MTLQMKQQMTTQGVFQGTTQTMGVTALSLIWARGDVGTPTGRQMTRGRGRNILFIA